jgi:predicted alpha/beta hydrolase family esterase
VLRYLESLPEGKMIKQAILVAPYTNDLNYDELKNFFVDPFGWEIIKSRCEKFTCILSDDDPFVPLKFAEEFKNKLGAEIIVKPHAGHFDGSTEPLCFELPEVIEAFI